MELKKNTKKKNRKYQVHAGSLMSLENGLIASPLTQHNMLVREVLNSVRQFSDFTFMSCCTCAPFDGVRHDFIAL